MGQYPTVLSMLIPDRPDSGYNCLLSTAVVRGTAKVSRSLFDPVRIDAVPATRLAEDVLLVVLASDAGWEIALERTATVPGLRVMPAVEDGDRPVTQPTMASGRLSASNAQRFHVHKRFSAAGIPQRIVVPYRVPAVASHAQADLHCDPVALRQAYPQCRLAVGTAQQIYTDGSGQTSGEDSSARIGAGVYDARSGREVTIDPCGHGPTHTVHRAELVAIQSALQHCARNEDVRILTDSQASMDGIRNYIQRPSHMQMHKHRDLLRDIVTRLAARGRNNLRTTMAKVAAHTGIEGNERADQVAKRAAAPDAMTDHSQPLGNRPFDSMFWLHTYEYATAAAKA